MARGVGHLAPQARYEPGGAMPLLSKVQEGSLFGSRTRLAWFRLVFVHLIVRSFYVWLHLFPQSKTLIAVTVDCGQCSVAFYLILPEFFSSL